MRFKFIFQNIFLLLLTILIFFVFFSNHLNIIWIFLSIIAKSFEDCRIEEKSSEQENILFCENINFKNNPEKVSDIILTDIEEISFFHITGDLKANLFKNANELEALLIYKSNIDTFEPEADTVKTVHIYHSHFVNYSNFNKCCRRLKKLLLRNSTGFFLEESIFQKLTRLQKLELSLVNMKHLTEAVLKGLTSLEKLRISYSNLEKIDGNAFIGLTKLKELYIHEPNIKDIDVNAFKPLKKLRVLNIMNAKNLEPLSLDILSELSNLRELGLPLKTWKNIDVEKIPALFPRLSTYSHSGDYENEDERNLFHNKLRTLNNLIFNKNNS